MKPASQHAFAGSPVLGRVVSVSDEESLGRVKVAYPLNAESDDIRTEAWAVVAVPFAGADYGAYMLPGVDDIVVLNFLGGDPRSPVVLGAVWVGQAAPPDEPGGAQMDRWLMKGRKGSRMAMIEPESGSPEIVLETPGGNRITLADDGTRITISAGSGASRIEMDAQGVKITAPKVEIKAPEMKVNSGKVDVKAAFSDFSGMVKGSVGQFNTVIATTYTTGAGNML